MPVVNKHLIEEGTFYKRHFCTIALCCPSRVSLLTGKAAQYVSKYLTFSLIDSRSKLISNSNTNVTDINPPYGMFSLIFTIMPIAESYFRRLPKIPKPGPQRRLPASLAPGVRI